MKKNSFIFIIFSLLSLTFFSLCTPVKNVIYFENLQKDTSLRKLINSEYEQKIRKNDLLSITIISPDPVTTPLFNGISIGSNEGGTGSAGVGGYLVDNEGKIGIYKLGTIHAEGLTRNQLKQKLQREL